MGGIVKPRALSRTSAHRQALLRNLVTSLFTHESITTSWAKAKEAQRLADKLVTLGKRNTQAARDKAKAVFYDHLLLPKLFGPLRERYAQRPGGYTRVLRIESVREDAAPSAILELVDRPRDTRMALAARMLATQRSKGQMDIAEDDWLTKGNVAKATRYRRQGREELEEMVREFQWLDGKRGEARALSEEFEGDRGEVEGAEEGGKRSMDERQKGFVKKFLRREEDVHRKVRVYPSLPRSRI